MTRIGEGLAYLFPGVEAEVEVHALAEVRTQRYRTKQTYDRRGGNVGFLNK
jgi:hypothetical protein